MLSTNYGLHSVYLMPGATWKEFCSLTFYSPRRC